MSVAEVTTFGIQKQLLDERTVAAKANVMSEADMSLQASEGDVVTFSFAEEQSLSQPQSETQFESVQTVPEISSIAQAASTFSQAIEGDLNEDELAAIQKLAAKIEPIAKDFLSSDPEELNIEKAIAVLTDDLGFVEEVERKLEKTIEQMFVSESFSQVNLDDVVLPDAASVETEVEDFDVENIRQLPTLVSATIDAGFEKQFQVLNKNSRELIINSLSELMQFFREKVVQVLEPLRHPASLEGGGAQVPVEVDLTAHRPA